MQTPDPPRPDLFLTTLLIRIKYKGYKSYQRSFENYNHSFKHPRTVHHISTQKISKVVSLHFKELLPASFLTLASSAINLAVLPKLWPHTYNEAIQSEGSILASTNVTLFIPIPPPNS